MRHILRRARPAQLTAYLGRRWRRLAVALALLHVCPHLLLGRMADLMHCILPVAHSKAQSGMTNRHVHEELTISFSSGVTPETDQELAQRRATGATLGIVRRDQPAAFRTTPKVGMQLLGVRSELHTFFIAPCQVTGSDRTAHFKQDRSDQGSLPCSRPPRSHARTPAARRCTHTLPRWPATGSLTRKPDRQRCQST